MSEQITFATSDFASNPEPRCPCILLLDVSGSMSGRPINELNAGLVTFRDELLADNNEIRAGKATFRIRPISAEGFAIRPARTWTYRLTIRVE